MTSVGAAVREVNDTGKYGGMHSTLDGIDQPEQRRIHYSAVQEHPRDMEFLLQTSDEIEALTNQGTVFLDVTVRSASGAISDHLPNPPIFDSHIFPQVLTNATKAPFGSDNGTVVVTPRLLGTSCFAPKVTDEDGDYHLKQQGLSLHQSWQLFF
jgi:hypothetical protein